MKYPECYPLWLESEVGGEWTTEHGLVAGARSLDEARDKAIELHARDPKKYTQFRVVKPNGEPVAEGVL